MMIRRGADFLRCSKCNGTYHKQRICSDLPGREVEGIDRGKWMCGACEGAPRRVDGAGGAKEVSYVERDQRRMPAVKDLKILQWNADAILSSREEMREYVKREDVDIWCIQETKLIKKDKTPHVQGYTVIRRDRKQAMGRESNRRGAVDGNKGGDPLQGGPEGVFSVRGRHHGGNDSRDPAKKQPETKDN